MYPSHRPRKLAAMIRRWVTAILLVCSWGCGGNQTGTTGPAATPAGAATTIDAGASAPAPDAARTREIDSRVASKCAPKRLQLPVAENPATGVIAGLIVDERTCEPLAGATIVATSPALQRSQAAITERDGHYAIVNLPPGLYTVSVYYLKAVKRTPAQRVAAGAAVEISTTIRADRSPVIEIRPRSVP